MARSLGIARPSGRQNRPLTFTDVEPMIFIKRRIFVKHRSDLTPDFQMRGNYVVAERTKGHNVFMPAVLSFFLAQEALGDHELHAYAGHVFDRITRDVLVHRSEEQARGRDPARRRADAGAERRMGRLPPLHAGGKADPHVQR